MTPIDRIKKKFESAEAEAFDAWQTHHAAEAMPVEPDDDAVPTAAKPDHGY